MSVRLTLGPVLFNWSAERLTDFYAHIADAADVDRVHLGEVVCGKRAPFTDAVWPEVIERLERAGKEVVISLLAMPSNVRERKIVTELAGDDRLVEVNDVTGLALRSGRPFVVGPFVNVYNEMAARFFALRGAKTICLPVEVPIASATIIAEAVPEAEIEIFAFGRMPLAVSGRCYHARLAGLHKDSCQFVCDRDLDGLDVSTLAGQSFLAINGIATMSHGIEAYCPPHYELETSGIRSLRLSPQTCDMAKVAGVYRALSSGAIEPNEARDRLVALDLPGPLVDGYTRGLAGATLAQPG